MTKIKIKIIGTGSYLPSKIVTNGDLSAILETDDEWISSRTGIKQRHIASPTENTSDLATHALKNALAMCNLEGNDLDAIIVITTTPDMIFPSTAIKVQYNVGMLKGFAFDMQTVCSGFVYGLYVAEKFLRTNAVKRVAIVGAEIMSRIVNWNDRSTCILFGDGAGAVILEAHQTTNASDILDVMLASDPSLQDALYARDTNVRLKNTSLNRLSHLIGDFISPNEEDFGIKMNGAAVFKNAVDGMVRMSLEVLERNNITHNDINWLLIHQANMRITHAVAEKLQIPLSKVMESITDCANTSVATIPIGLDKYVRNNPQLQRGDLLLVATAGAGMTFSSAIIRF